MTKWTNLERVWSSWNIFQLSSLKMLNFLTTFDKQFCGSTKPGDYYHKFMVLSWCGTFMVLAKFYLSTTFGLRLMISSAAPKRSWTFTHI